MKKTSLTLIGAAVGLLCAWLFIGLWRDEPGAQPPPTEQTVADSPSSPAASNTTLSEEPPATITNPVARALLQALRRSLARPDVRPNEAVLAFKDDAALARFLARGIRGLTVVGRLDAAHAVRVHFDDFGALQDDLAQNAGDLADASGNYTFNVPQVPAKQARAAQQQVPFHNTTLDFIGATGDRSSWGRGVTIAVLDTGVGADPTFGNGRITTYDLGLGTSPGKGSEDGHGTSVASLAAGAAPDAAGVAPAANLLSIRVTDSNGTSDIFTIAQAIVTAVDSGAKVINVSLGGYGTNAALNSAIDYAVNHGSVIVAAAGNDQAAQLAWPAADPRVVSVGAVDKAEQQVIFSNSGPQLQLSAPGLGVQTAWADGQRAYVDGTSASAPLVSGSIAALLSQNPTLTAAEAVQILNRTASDQGIPGADPAYGNGILNVGWAMNVNNPSYLDTAVVSHYFDAANNQMDFTIQNRSTRAVSNLSFFVAAGVTSNNFLIPELGAGQSQLIKVPVDATQLSLNGKIQYTTTLVNPIGMADQVPANNHRSSVLSAPAKKK